MRLVPCLSIIAAFTVGCDAAAERIPNHEETAAPTASTPSSPPSADPTASTPPPPASPPSTEGRYVLATEHTGASFFDGFAFANIADPTHGTVNYVDEATAKKLGLVSIDERGHARIAVESKTVATSPGRMSVRLESKQTYEEGLFVIDVEHLPEGNAVWPAFWMVGAKWPTGGEIDIIEGVSDQSTNASTLHTSAQCSMKGVDTSTMTGQFTERDCNAGDKSTGMPYIGCGVRGAEGSFGPTFNAGGGGVFAMKRTVDAIDIWAWPRSSIPPDLAPGQTPAPNTWGKPVAHFALGAECASSHFGPQRMILNTTLCGDWAGNVFVGSGGKSGPAACRDYVLQNPAKFANAYWDVASIRAFTWKDGT